VTKYYYPQNKIANVDLFVGRLAGWRAKTRETKDGFVFLVLRFFLCEPLCILLRIVWCWVMIMATFVFRRYLAPYQKKKGTISKATTNTQLYFLGDFPSLLNRRSEISAMAVEYGAGENNKNIIMLS
jgi:hypothetical protein